jgi:hypothetical protein
MDLAFHNHILQCRIWARGSKVTTDGYCSQLSLILPNLTTEFSFPTSAFPLPTSKYIRHTPLSETGLYPGEERIISTRAPHLALKAASLIEKETLKKRISNHEYPPAMHMTWVSVVIEL